MMNRIETKHGLRRVVIGAALALSLSPLAATAAQPQSNSGIQVLHPSELGRTEAQMPGSPHAHIRQRGDYGGNYRYGHAVNGPQGDIVIWSAPNSGNYGGHARPRFGTRQARPQTQPLTGPRLEYKPDYGKPPARRD